MKICYVSSEYPTNPPSRHGGIGTILQLLGRRLVAAGHHVIVVGQSSEAFEYDDQGVRVKYIKACPIPKLGAVVNLLRIRRMLRRMARRRDVDLIEATQSSAAFLPFDVDVPVIVRLHGGHRFVSANLGMKPRLVSDMFQHWYLKKAKTLVGVSRFVLERSIKLNRLHPISTHVIPNAVDADLFCPDEKVTPEPDLIAFAGTLYRVKGIYQLIDAMQLVLRERPNAKLIMAGKDGGGPSNSVRAELVRRMSDELRQRVKFLGVVPHDELKELYLRASVCVFPSLSESFGIVAIEAMSCGRPVVFTNLGPGPEVIEDGVSGFLCDPYDPRDISSKVLQVLRDRELAESMGLNARQRVLERFSADVVVERNLQFYEKCLDEHRSK